ncbi:MAG: glycosyltransferase family 9 protein [Desulfobacteraceae bacterium]|nr:glycosyltransferase family 9 protein [Pseudomonadota bacterium]MBU4462593.1 glycosyltransferase family 9 protein [Pseudomonadota bacterium]MCG2755598.1 glycosyltransferase family 9 protein [Desulfobacteraceae bacterium]
MLVKGNSDLIKDIRSILLIQLGDIGDVVWATPTFRAVKEAYPQANVSVLLRESFGSLLEADPHIHKIFEVKRYNGNILKRARKQLSFIRDLRTERFDLVFDLRSDDRGAYTALLSGAQIRAALLYRGLKWRNLLFTHLVDPPASKERIYGAAEQSLCIVREFGIDTKDTIPKLWVSEKVKRRAEKLLDDNGVTAVSRWITLNPFSRWEYKEWEHEKWVQVIDWLWEEYGIATVVVGAPEEREKSIDIVNKCKGRIYNLTGRTSLDELAGVLSLSSLHIGVDSAAPHIAAAVGIHTITIYGPSEWLVWAPLGEIHSVVTPDRDCAPCHQKGCDGSGTSKCLEELTIDKVERAIHRALDKSGILTT